ncbi:MAG: glycosyltransferase family 4 protein, partial [Microbacteriaceae bacterium]|nr:glycosyltransferase family 4 protein [Microbacteriaceae bacterium]
MRILVISNLLPPRMLGGFELAALNLSRALRERGHEVLVLTSPAMQEAPEQDGWVERTLNVRDKWFEAVPPEPEALREVAYQSQVSNPSNALIVLDRVRAFRPDHILAFGLIGLGGLNLLATLRDTGVPVTLNLGDDVPKHLLGDVPPAVREAFDAEALFASMRAAIVSRTLGREIAQTVALGPTAYIARGVRYADVPRSRPHRDGGIARFVSVGILAPHKGIDVTFDAIERVAGAGRRAFVVHFFGDGDAEHWSREARVRGFGDQVVFHGKVSQLAVAEAEAGADALIFPTWHREPGASVAGEAAAVGCVPIMTGDCGPSEWFVDGVNAIKIERDPADLAEAMRRVIDGEVDLDAMAAAGRRLASGSLSFDRSVSRLESWLAAGTPEAPARDVDHERLAARIVERDGAARSAWDHANQES